VAVYAAAERPNSWAVIYDEDLKSAVLSHVTSGQHRIAAGCSRDFLRSPLPHREIIARRSRAAFIDSPRLPSRILALFPPSAYVAPPLSPSSLGSPRSPSSASAIRPTKHTRASSIRGEGAEAKEEEEVEEEEEEEVEKVERRLVGEEREPRPLGEVSSCFSAWCQFWRNRAGLHARNLLARDSLSPLRAFSPAATLQRQARQDNNGKSIGEFLLELDDSFSRLHQVRSCRSSSGEREKERDRGKRDVRSDNGIRMTARG